MRPKKIAEPKIRYIKMPKKYAMLMLFGTVFVNKRYKGMGSWAFNELLYHERIHIQQAAFEHNSWFVFYIKYIYYWIRNMFYCKFNFDVAVACIPYEMEATFQEIFWRLDSLYNCHNLKKFKAFPFKKALLLKQKNGDWHSILGRMIQYV